MPIFKRDTELRSWGPLVLVTICALRLGAQAPSAEQHRYPPAPLEPSKLVHTRYDAQYDKSILQIDPIALDTTLAVSALVALDGRPVRKDAPGVVLTFWSTAPNRPLAAARRVTLTLDGTATELGDAWLTPQPRQGYTEVGMRSMPLDLWLNLASAREARIRIGTREFLLSAETQRAIQDFASRMSPQGAGK